MTKRRLSLLVSAALVAMLLVAGGRAPDRAAAAPAPTRTTAAAVPDPSHPGTWQITASCTVNGEPVNAIHDGVTRDGRVLIVAGTGYNVEHAERDDQGVLKVNSAWLYDPATPSVCPREIPLPADKDLFCAGHTHLPDGRMLFFGGTEKYGEGGSAPGDPRYYTGIRDAFVFDEASETFQPMPSMTAARWYGQGTADAHGNVVVVGGLDEQSNFTPVNERFNAATKTWSTLPARAFPMYAGMALMPDQQFAYTGTYFSPNHLGMQPLAWNPTTNATTPIPGLQYPDCRDQGSSVVQYPRVYVIGGGCGASTTGTVSVLDMTKKPYAFTNGPYLGYAAMHICAATLPDRSLFVSGGANHNASPQWKARRLGPGATSWQTLANPTVARMYHSTCLVLPDGSVLTMGTNTSKVENRFEVYRPWYMQPGLVRPRIASLSRTVAPLGGTIDVTYEVATIKSATLTSIPSSTHSAPEGRQVVPGIVPGEFGKTTVRIPTNGTTTPPGFYMLSLLDWRGAPTIARIIQITDPTAKRVAGNGGGAAPPVGCCCC